MKKILFALMPTWGVIAMFTVAYFCGLLSNFNSAFKIPFFVSLVFSFYLYILTRK